MTTASEAGAWKRDRARIAIGLAVLLMLAFFWPTLWSFTNTWSLARYHYAHGWLVPGLVAWLIWNERAAFREGRGGDPLLLIPLVGLSLFWLASTITHIQLFYQTAFVLLLVFWGFFVFGRASARTVVVSGAVVLLSLPLWEVFVPILRRLTTLMSGAMVTLVRVPAEIDGDLIHLPSGTFEIADGCAGLNYLLSALVIGIVYAQVLVRGTAARILVVATATAVAIVGNWIRVALLVVIGHVTEMQAWLIPNHIEFGWGVFFVGLVLFFMVAGRIERRAARAAKADGEPALAHAEGMLEDEPAPAVREPVVEAPLAPADTGGWMKRAGVASALAVAGPVLFLSLAALPAVDDDARSLSAVAGGTGWRAVAPESNRPFDWRPAYQGAQQHDRVSFTDGTAYVYGDRFVFREQAQDAKLIGYPNRIAPSRDILDHQVVGPVDPAGRLRVRQAVIRTPDGPILTWYWYRVGGVDTFMPVHAKVLEIPAFLTRRRASQLIAFSAPCEPTDCTNAFEALAGFMGTRRAPDSASVPE
jgi:exosortase